jgi:hypothetical protein
MKSILYLLLGLMLGAAVRGQGLPGSDSALSRWKLQVPGPSPLSINGFLQSPEKPQGLWSTWEGPVRVLKPDFMSCLVPDLSKVERMPVRRAASADPMPNGFRSGRVWSMEIRPAGK